MPTQKASVPTEHHHFRTFFAAIFGIVAMFLILASILVVWLNRTLLDTTTYVNTVAPVVTQIDVQNFVADKATEQLVNNAPTHDVAEQLLSANQITGKTDDQLRAELQPVIRASILQVVQSASFVDLWKTTNQTTHSELIQQLNSGSSEISLNLTPAVAGVIDQIRTTKLSPIADKIVDGPPSIKVDLKGSTVDTIIHYYNLYKKLYLLLLVVTLLAIVLCVVTSVHHIKTLRRIIFGTGILSLVLAILLSAPRFIAPKLDDPQQKAALAVATVLLHNLWLTTIILAVVCLLISIGSKFHPHPAVKTGIVK